MAIGYSFDGLVQHTNTKVKKSGDEMTGHLTLPSLVLINPTDGGATDLVHTDDWLRFRIGSTSTVPGFAVDFYDTRAFAVYRSGSIWAKEDVLVGENNYKVYHQGFHPTAVDVGALPITGGTMTGSIKIDSYGIKGVRDAGILRDHGDGNVTLSAGMTSDGVTPGVLWLGYNGTASGINYSTKEIGLYSKIMCRVTAAGPGAYAIDMLNNAIGGLNTLAFADPADAGGEGILFPKTGYNGSDTDISHYDKLYAIDGNLFLNGNRAPTVNSSSGVMEIGQHLDFVYNNSGADFDVRVGLTNADTLSVEGATVISAAAANLKVAAGTIMEGTATRSVWGYGSSDVYVSNHISNKYLQLKNDGTLQYSNQKVFHEGQKQPHTIGTPIELGAGVDLDTLKTPGVYSQNANADTSLELHYPEALAGSLIVYQAAGWIQEYRVYNTSRIWVRAQYGSSGWTAWHKTYNTGNKPTAADVGASPSNHNHDTVYIKNTGNALITGDKFELKKSSTFSGARIISTDTEAFYYYTNDANVAVCGLGVNTVSGLASFTRNDPTTGAYSYTYLQMDPGGNTTVDANSAHVRLRGPESLSAQGTGAASLVRKDYLDSQIATRVPTSDASYWNSNGSLGDLNGAPAAKPGHFTFSPGAVGSPSSGIYGHGFTFGPGADPANGIWYSQIVAGHDGILYHRKGVNAAATGGWEKLYTTNFKPTLADIGAAASSHHHSAAEGNYGIIEGGMDVTGAYAFMYNKSSSFQTNGNFLQGSQLQYAGARDNIRGSNPYASGTWKCMGAANASGGSEGESCTLWFRTV